VLTLHRPSAAVDDKEEPPVGPDDGNGTQPDPSPERRAFWAKSRGIF
jgi:hypothetical protein